MKNILIIDHHSYSGLLLKDSLVEDFQVFEATSINEAFDLVHKHAMDLILLDVETPDGSGSDICARLKEMKEAKYIPLILLCPYEQKEDIIDGIYSGADDYMIKPVCARELSARIDVHLRTKDYYSDLEKEDLLMLLELTEIISVTRNPIKILTIIVEKMVQAINLS